MQEASAMALKTIRLELARNPDFPEGSSRHGYELQAPLQPDGHLDQQAWRNRAAPLPVRRFWAGEADRHGELVHTRHGWAFSYAPGEDDDEALFRLDRHLFRPGEYVTVTEPSGAAHTFRVVSTG
jgi:hypothetical protein